MFDPNQVHIDAALTNLTRKFQNGDLVAERIAKVFPVQKFSDKFFRYIKQSDFKVPDTVRRSGSESNEVHLRLDSDDYATIGHALKELIDDDTRKNADPAINPDADATEHVTNLLRLRLEKDVAAEMTTIGN